MDKLNADGQTELQLTTEDCPLKSRVIVGACELLGIATVTSYMAGTNDRM